MPTITIIEAFPTMPNEVAYRTYRIDENGRGEQSYYDGQKKIKTSIETPEVEFLSSDGSIRIKNNFFEKESTPWKLTSFNKLDVSLNASKGPISSSFNPLDGTLSTEVTIASPTGVSPYSKTGTETNPTEGTTSMSVEGGIKGSVNGVEANVGVFGSKTSESDENGEGKQTYRAGTTVGAEILRFLSIKRSIGYEIEPGKTKKIREDSNNVYHYLPANLQESLVNDLFKNASNKMKFYENETDVVIYRDEAHLQHRVVTRDEKKQIHEQLVKSIRSANVPDVKIQPSNIQFIEGPLYSRQELGQSQQEE